MLGEPATCGRVVNDQHSGQLPADSNPFAIRAHCGGTQRSTQTNVLSQRSHFLCGCVQAEDGNQLAEIAVADHGQRQSIGRQGETFDSIEFLIDGGDQLAVHGVPPPNLVIDDDQPIAVPCEYQTSIWNIGGIDLERFFARGCVKSMNLVRCGQRDQSAVGGQGADLGVGAAGKVAAMRFVFVLRLQVPATHLAVLIQRHQLTIRVEGTARDRDLMP